MTLTSQLCDHSNICFLFVCFYFCFLFFLFCFVFVFVFLCKRWFVASENGWNWVEISERKSMDAWETFDVKNWSAQAFVFNSFQAIGIIINANLFIKASRWKLQQILLVTTTEQRHKNLTQKCPLLNSAIRLCIILLL